MSTERRDEERAEGGEPVFPPTDPVLSPSGESVGGGFGRTSMDEIGLAHSTLDRRPGDEALADAIRRELSKDAFTTHLDISVDVRGGVAFLRGHVDDLEDTDNVAEVASRVPGVRQVVDQMAFPAQ